VKVGATEGKSETGVLDAWERPFIEPIGSTSSGRTTEGSASGRRHYSVGCAGSARCGYAVSASGSRCAGLSGVCLAIGGANARARPLFSGGGEGGVNRDYVTT